MSDFFRQPVEAVTDAFSVTPSVGLSQQEVDERLERYGLNELPTDEGTNWVRLIIGQFTDIMVLILLAAAVVSLFLGETTDVIIIMVIVALNATLGIYQEFRAEQALAALNAMQVPMVRVRRQGVVRQISATELVPGDIVLLEEGGRVPADGRVIESINLRVEEAALTGESVPTGKHTQAIEKDGDIPVGDRNNSAYMGTSVTYGRGEMVVTGTGMQTEIGSIANMLLNVQTGPTPLTRQLNTIGRVLAIGAGIVVVIVFLTGWLVRGIPADQMFLVAISLAVAAVPEGLPALVTISLSLGASRMARRNALIRRLPAVETLGSVDVICSDKTGTLTKNEMTATYLMLPGHDNLNVSGIGYRSVGEFTNVSTNEVIQPMEDAAVERFLKSMALSTNANLEEDQDTVRVIGDTTEGALMVAARKVGWTREELEKSLPRVAELPFSSERKAMTTIHAVEGEEAKRLFGDTPYISITKGAPDRLIPWASHEYLPDGADVFSEGRRRLWFDRVDKMADEGLRVLGIAFRRLDAVPEKIDEAIERDLAMLGLVGILDPARPEVRESVQVAREAGIRTIMITGDHKLTAMAIAQDLGIIQPGGTAITGSELDQMSEDEMREAITTTSCFARVSPAHKLELVRILQSDGNTAAMTGDGVNDAPALKQADIGVAMGITGTDVSKGAADMVLTDDNFSTIVAAVEEGRAIYDNIRKFIKYLLSSNVGEILVMFVGLLIGLPLPLLAIHILWINLVTDGLPAIALGFEKGEPGIMKRRPRARSESIFARGVGRHIAWVGVLIAALTLAGFVWGYNRDNLDPLDSTLGLERLSAAQVATLVGDEFLIDRWDSLSVAQRDRILSNHFEELTAEEITTITDQDLKLPENWDTLSTDERTSALASLFGDDATYHQDAGEGILGVASRVPQTIAFTVLAFTQMFEVMAIHAGDGTSFFRTGFRGNRLMLLAVLSTFILQLFVIYTPIGNTLLRTAPLEPIELFVAFLLGSVVLFGVEFEKYLNRRFLLAEA
jgi:P-type Ca2+ transporter type 2C